MISSLCNNIILVYVHLIYVVMRAMGSDMGMYSFKERLSVIKANAC